jgi:integrase
VVTSLQAYAGLRPGEVSALPWLDVGERTLLVQRATAPDGTIKATKNARSRSVRLLPALAAELREWRLASGRPGDDALVIPGPGGRPWTNTDWHNWRSRQWREACEAIGLQPTPRPYDLRHSFASLLLAERCQPLYVAQQLGNTPAVMWQTYAHLISEYEDAERVEADSEILKARERAAG